MHVDLVSKRWGRLLLTAAALFAVGCDGCHRSKPYTPYTLGAGPSATAPLPHGNGNGNGNGDGRGGIGPAASASAAPATFTAVVGTRAPGNGKTWPLPGGSIATAPPGRVFDVGLVLDVDGDGKPDLLAWARAPDGLRGEVWFVSGGSPEAGRIVAALPADLSSSACTATATLAQVGPRTVAFDHEPRCDHDRATRWIAVLRFPLPGAGGAPEIGFELRVGAPLAGESLAIAVDARDRDGDGRDDIALKVTLTGAPHPFPSAGATAHAALAFFDRPAGFSRDPSEPEASLRSLAAGLVADARRKTSAPRVAGGAFALRRLHALLCDESGKSVMTSSAGPIRCGEPRYLEESLGAEIEAALNVSDPLAAFAALARLEAIGAHPKDVDALIALVTKAVPSVAASVLRKTTVAPHVEPAPASSPLAFEPSGDFLVRAESGVVRVDRTSFAEAPVDAPAPWPPRLGFPAESPAWSLGFVEQRCDRPLLVGRFDMTDSDGPSGGTPPRPREIETALPIQAAPKCASTARLPAVLLGASAQGFVVAVGAETFALGAANAVRAMPAESLAPTPGTGAVLGAARSPDGATIAVRTSRGVLVATVKGTGRTATARLWTGLDAAAFCVPDTGGAHLACVTGGSASLFDAK